MRILICVPQVLMQSLMNLSYCAVLSRGFHLLKLAGNCPMELLKTGSTILHVTVKTENDFGRYRCIAKSLEKNDLTVNITIRKRSK